MNVNHINHLSGLVFFTPVTTASGRPGGRYRCHGFRLPAPILGPYLYSNTGTLFTATPSLQQRTVQTGSPMTGVHIIA